MELKNSLTLTFGLALALSGVGCSNKSSNSTDAGVAPAAVVNPTPLPTPPPTTNPNVSTTASNSATFTPVSLAEMNSYVAIRPLNAPSNYKVSVDLTADSEGRYSGAVKISYDDNGQRYEGVFNSGTGTNSYLQYSPNNGYKEYVYNIWFIHNTKQVFSGFFQDAYGSVVLVIDGTSSVDLGDGQGAQVTLNGQIWYRNFPQLLAPQGPERKCWYITAGPYDCRSTPVIYKNGLVPSDTYRKLGTFTGLHLSKAFH